MPEKPHESPQQKGGNNEANETGIPTVILAGGAKEPESAQETDDPRTAIEKAENMMRSAWLWCQSKAQWCWNKVPRFLKQSAVWTALATVVIAIASGIYTYYANKQWTVMRAQLNQMQANERAWIGIERNANVESTPETLTIQYIIKNVGHSEAAIALVAKVIRNDEPWRDRLREFREDKLRYAKDHWLPGKRWGKGGWTVIPEFPMQYDWHIKPAPREFPVTLVGCVLYAPLPDSELPDTTCFVTTISRTKSGFLVETLPAENTTEYQNAN